MSGSMEWDPMNYEHQRPTSSTDAWVRASTKARDKARGYSDADVEAKLLDDLRARGYEV
jgi:hypothetical protein